MREIKEADIAIRQDFTEFEDWYTPWLTGQGIVGALLMSLSPTDRTRLEAALRAGWGDGPFSFAATARLAIGMAAWRHEQGFMPPPLPR